MNAQQKIDSAQAISDRVRNLTAERAKTEEALRKAQAALARGEAGAAGDVTAHRKSLSLIADQLAGLQAIRKDIEKAAEAEDAAAERALCAAAANRAAEIAAEAEELPKKILEKLDEAFALKAQLDQCASRFRSVVRPHGIRAELVALDNPAFNSNNELLLHELAHRGLNVGVQFPRPQFLHWTTQRVGSLWSAVEELRERSRPPAGQGD